MSDLVEFLRARLDEDERDAIDWHFDAGIARGWESLKDRVLAEVEAKRRIIDGMMRVGESGRLCLTCGDERWYNVRDLILVEMVQPYADHPDFDPEWKLRV